MIDCLFCSKELYIFIINRVKYSSIFLSLLNGIYTVCVVFGEGLSGKATYSFELVFCEPINTEVNNHTGIFIIIFI